MGLRGFKRWAIMFAVLLLAAPAMGEIIIVGDNDGYGFGVPDNGTGVIWPGLGPSGSSYDGRSAAEASAINGAQFTDVYSALYPGFGPNPSEIGSFIFPLSQPMLSAVLTIDMGDFQASDFGQVAVDINGIAQPNMFNFQDGFQNTVVRSFPIGASEIAAANLAGQLLLTVNHTGSADFIAFDYLELNTTAVPEPAAMILLGSGLVGLIGFRRKLRK